MPKVSAPVDKVSAPVIKCKKTAVKKCNFMVAGRREKKIDSWQGEKALERSQEMKGARWISEATDKRG